MSARKFITAGQTIKHLTGTLVAMTREEETDLDLTRRDFSIVMSSRRKTPSLFLGPARFANHDCNANGRLVMRGLESMEVVATRDIDIGEEITVSYGENYFGTDNCECLCHSCEITLRNGWSQAISVESASPRATPPASSDETDSSLLSTTAAYFDDLSEGSTRRQTSRGSKRRKIERKGSNLRTELSPPNSPITVQPPHLQTSVDNQDTYVNGDIKAEPQSEGYSHGIESDSNMFSNSNTTREAFPAVDQSSNASSIVDTSQSTRSTAETSVEDTTIRPRISETKASPNQPSSSARDEPVHSKPLKIPDLLLPDDDDDGELSDLSTSWEMNDADERVVKRSVDSTSNGRKRSLVPTIEQDSPLARVPGDYTKTPKLLAQKYDRWVDCSTCNAWFVQGDSYLTRKECPRCERHSKLYGYRWPKTDREGRHDSEERIMDHRTVHRFLTAEEESKVQRRGRGVSFGVSPTPEISDTRTETDASEIGDEGRVTRNRRRAARESRFST